MNRNIYHLIILAIGLINSSLYGQGMGACEPFTVDSLQVIYGNDTISNGDDLTICLVEGQRLIPLINSLNNDNFSPDCDVNNSFFTWEWSSPGGQITFPCITPTEYGMYNLDIECTGGGNEINYPFTFTFTLTEPESCLPNISIEPVACEDVSDDMVTLTAVPSGGPAEGTIIQWNGPGVNDVIGASIPVPVPTSGPDPTYTARIFVDGMPSTFNESSITLEVEEFNPTVSLMANETTVCSNETTNITATYNESFDLAWFAGNMELTGLANDPVISRGPGNYRAVVTSNIGCTNEATINISSATQPDQPMVNVSTQDRLCPGETAVLSIDGPVGGLTYEWSDDTDPSFMETGTSINVTSEGTFFVVATQDGCDSDESEPILIRFEEYDAPTFSLPNQVTCEGQTASISLSNLDSDYEVMWSTGDTGPSTMINTGGDYGYTITFGEANCMEEGVGTVPDFNPLPVLPDQLSEPLTSGSPSQVPLDVGTDDVDMISWMVIETSEATAEPTQDEIAFDEDIAITLTSSSGQRATGAVILELTPISMLGCVGEPVELLIQVLPDAEEPFIPQIVSPNGDGDNDEWTVLFPDPDATYDIVVYSRGGGVVFSGTQEQIPWDTGECPNGTYYYQITETNGDGVWQGALSIIGRR